MQTDIGKLAGIDGGERLADGVDEGVAADEAAARMCLRLRDQMFGAAETDFQPHLTGRICEQRAQIGGRRFGQIEREVRQSCVEQRGLPRLQCMTLAPAEEGAQRLVFVAFMLAHGVIVRASARHDNGEMTASAPRA